MNRSTVTRLTLAAAVGLAASSAAHAQHAKFVLFGDPNPDAAAAPAEHTFVHPVTAPYFHEDSFITSDVRAWLVYHKFPTDVAVGGGNATVAALQVRLAITNWIQLVAYKDGYTWFDTPLIDEDGWNDVGAGLKFGIIQDYKNQFHVSAGAGYEFPWGDGKILQNDADVRLWASVNKGFDRLHLGATFNYFFTTSDKDEDLGNSDRISWHLHADYRLNDWLSPVLEFNGFHNLDNNASPLDFTGVDVADLGNAVGDPVVTIAPGLEVRPTEDFKIRAAVEAPLTDNVDLYGYRLTFSAVLSF